MKRPDVSIVLLTWNRVRFLEICLRELFSALTPTEAGGLTREIILMDNGSTDGTAEVLARYAKRPDVRVIYNDRNLRLNAYKRLFWKARGRTIIEVDDDVLEFPKDFDRTLVDYLAAYPDYGFLSLNVRQNEKTNGAKPPSSAYQEDARGKRLIEEGPAGGWCAAFRRRHLLRIMMTLLFRDITMAKAEDGLITGWFRRHGLRVGIVREAECLHATGPLYALEFNQLDREIQKYAEGGCPDFVEAYGRYKGKRL